MRCAITPLSGLKHDQLAVRLTDILERMGRDGLLDERGTRRWVNVVRLSIGHMNAQAARHEIVHAGTCPCPVPHGI